jgi:hypothetical protein
MNSRSKELGDKDDGVCLGGFLAWGLGPLAGFCFQQPLRRLYGYLRHFVRVVGCGVPVETSRWFVPPRERSAVVSQRHSSQERTLGGSIPPLHTIHRHRSVT